MVKKQRHRLSKKRQGILHHLLNTFFPRAHNGYHPHFISRYGLVALALVFTGTFGVAVQDQGLVLGSEADITPPALLKNINLERTKLSKTSLELNPQLSAAALSKGKDMIANQYWAHTSPDGVTPWKWLDDQEYVYAYAGENLARNFANADATVAAWMASPTHRDNILHDYYTEAGFGVVHGEMEGKSTSIVVALFATPASALTRVAGVTTETGVMGMTFNPLAQLGIALQAMNPSMLGAMSLLMVGMAVAGLTFTSTHMRALRPNRLHQTVSGGDSPSWHQHHAVIKLIGMMTIAVVCIVLVGGGRL